MWSDGYEANSENDGKSLAFASKKRGKSNLVKTEERYVFQSNRGNESNESDSILEKNIMHTDSSQWERFSEFEDIISDCSDSDSLTSSKNVCYNKKTVL